MEANRSQFVVKLLPSFTDFAFLMPIVFLFGRMNGVKTLLNDCDTGWHIRTGEWILANRAIPAHDVFSFSKPGGPWFAWEWLSDILFAGLNAAGGLRAVAIFGVVLLAVIFTMLYRLVRRRSNAIVAILITMLAAAASSIHWLARPHLFTLLFLIIFYEALERVRNGRTHVAGLPILAVLPVLTVLWTNLHAGFFVGVLMLGAYGGGEILTMLLSADTAVRPAAWQRAKGYFLSAAACMAASLVNPYTYHLHVHMFQYLRDPWNSQHIMEFFSPNFHHPTAIFFEMMLVLAAASCCWFLSKGRYTEPMLMLVWAHGALLAARNIPLFALAAAPFIAAAIEEWLEWMPQSKVAGWVHTAVGRFNRLAAATGETDAIGRWHLVSAGAVLLVTALIWAPNPPKTFRAEFDPDHYPSAALAVFRQDAGVRIFTHDEWGDYLIWRLYPKQRVFVDGRSDFYGDDFEQTYMDVLQAKFGWEKTLNGFGVNAVLLPPDSPLTSALKESSRWHVVYDDGIALVFRPNAGTVAATISSTVAGDGTGRDREVTKTQASDRAITKTIKSKS